jgi:hypothetical protein
MRSSLKNLIRPAATRLTTAHRPGDLPDIAVLSSPRSGSTWLMEIIATQPKMKFINEPDHKELLEHYHALRVAPRHLWLSLTPRERQDLALYLLDDRRSGLFGPADPFAANHSWRTNRRVMKLIRMTPLVEWLTSLGFATVYLLRHPIPQAQSCIRRNHRIVLDDVLADNAFLNRLDSNVVAYVRQVAEGGDAMLQFVTQWCVENVTALNSALAGGGFALTTHELLVSDPSGEMSRLADILSLEHVDLLLKRVSAPSRTTDSSSASTVADIRAGASSRLLDMWRSDMSDKQEQRLLEPLQVFGIDLYTPGESMPAVPAHWTATSETLDCHSRPQGGETGIL